MTSGRGDTGNRRYRTNRAILLSQNQTCGICGHGPAEGAPALTADHIVPAKLWPRDAAGRPLPGLHELTNLRPAHGTLGGGQPDNPCNFCGRYCNQSRGARVAARPASRDWFPQGIPRA